MNGTSFLVVAAIITAVQAIATGAGLYGSGKHGVSIGSIAGVAITASLGAYFIPQLLIFMTQPTMSGGVFGGWAEVVIFYLLSQIPASLLALILGDAMDWDASATNTIIVGVGFLVVIVLMGIVSGISNWTQNTGDGAAQVKVNYADVRVAKGYDEMPATDPAHIVLVTKAIASYEGQQAISSNGQNLGSTFHTESSQYTLQSVRNHLYWIAPLTYNTTSNQANNADTPGFVMVDAENPNAQAQLVQKDLLGHDIRIHYVIGGFLDRDVHNHLYYAGYQACNLDDITLEVDDNLTPWYTITCLGPIPNNSFYMYHIQSVLLMNPSTGAVTSYKPGTQPTWVDRIVSTATANQLVDDWTRYKYAPYWQFNTQTGQLQRTGDPELLYNYAVDPKTGKVSDAPVFLYQITSASASDTTSTGFMLYDTQSLHGAYYPLGGVTVGNTVNQVFEKAPGNLRNYDVGSVQFYNLYGQPTWVAIYQQTNDFGATFQAVGIVNASHLDGANVIMADNIADALTGYQTWLATAGSKVQNGTSKSLAATFTGTVARINETTENNKSVYYLMLNGSNHVFRVDATLPGFQPNTEVGDKVRVEYIEANTQVVSLSAFDNLTIDQLATAGASPTATPSH